MSGNPLTLAKAAIKPAIAPADFRVFVFGPALDPAATIPVPTCSVVGHEGLNQHAQYLRYFTKHALEKEGFTVDYGETKEVLEFWTKRFKSGNPGRTEMLHASKVCGAIIIFPSSIGSISELALVARDGLIAEKTMAIVHDAYENDPSFFRLGVVELFQDYNGRTNYLDYTKHDHCVGYAKRFVEGKYHRALEELHDIKYKKSRYKGGIYEQLT